MAYIIDLTLILQNVFWLQVLTDSQGQDLSRRLIKAAAVKYYTSNTKQTLRFKIDQHLNSSSFNVGPRSTLGTIIELIEECTLDPSDMWDYMGSISFDPRDVVEDEAWDVSSTKC